MSKSYSKLNILQVVPTLSSGGVERIVCELAKFLQTNNHKVIILTKGGMLAEELSKLGIHIIHANVASKNPWVVFKNIWLIQRIIKEYDIDIIHVHSRGPAWSCWLAKCWSSVRLVTSFHGIYGSNNIFKRFYNSVMLKGDRIIAVSNYVKHHILENYLVDENKIQVIQNGVDHALFNHHFSKDILENFQQKYQIRSGIPVILLPARFTSWKGHLFLINALRLVVGQFQCIMVGKYPKNLNYLKQIENEINNANLKNYIKLFPAESNMPALYAITDIIVSSSTNPEAFGLTIIEGQLMEKLVIAPNYGGAGETIINDVTGIHYQFRDYNSLASKIDYGLSLKRPQIKAITHQASNHAIEKFSQMHMQSQTLKVYQDLKQTS